MIPYLGDFDEDATVYIPLNTFSSDDPSASVTITDLADADIMVHKDGGTTQIVTDGATVAIDYDGITGNHLITIDTSAHADYSIGSDYLVRMEGTTVDAGTINAWIAQFSIENRHSAGALRPTTAGRTLDVTAGGTAGIDWANVEAPTTAVDLSSTNIDVDQVVSSVSGAAGSVTGAVGSVTGNVGGNVTGTVGSVVGAVGSVAGNVDGNVTGSVGSNLELGPTEVNTQVVDVLKTDTVSEMSQGAPPLTPTMEDILNYLYRELIRNKVVVDTNTLDQKQIFADDGSTPLYEKGLTNATNITTIDEATTGA